MKSALLVVLVLVCTGEPAAIGFGQTPKYEVASIKPSSTNRENGGPMRWSPGGRFTASGAKLKELIQLAYEAQDFQISGGPDWIESERYDIVAVPDREVPFSPANAGTMYTMLQMLLADRFQLKLHREMREMQVYTLVVGKSGPKLQQAQAADGSNWEIKYQRNPREFTAINTPLDIFAKALLQELNRTVIDKTALKGYFDFTLKWSPEVPANAPPAADRAPSIFTAIQEQLGLKLESARGAVEVLIIDHVERPTAN